MFLHFGQTSLPGLPLTACCCLRALFLRSHVVITWIKASRLFVFMQTSVVLLEHTTCRWCPVIRNVWSEISTRKFRNTVILHFCVSMTRLCVLLCHLSTLNSMCYSYLWWIAPKTAYVALGNELCLKSCPEMLSRQSPFSTTQLFFASLPVSFCLVQTYLSNTAFDSQEVFLLFSLYMWLPNAK